MSNRGRWPFVLANARKQPYGDEALRQARGANRVFGLSPADVSVGVSVDLCLEVSVAKGMIHACRELKLQHWRGLSDINARKATLHNGLYEYLHSTTKRLPPTA